MIKSIDRGVAIDLSVYFRHRSMVVGALAMLARRV